MIDFLATCQRAADQAVPFMGEPITYQGGVYKGVINERDQSELIAVGGFEQHMAGSLSVSKTGFPVPVIGQRITVQGVDRRISRVTSQPTTWNIQLEHVQR